MDKMMKLLMNLVRVGTVCDVSGARARVRYQDTGITSEWLYALQHGDGGISVSEAGVHTHKITDSFGGGSASDAGTHTHEAKTTQWAPKIGQTVVVLYKPESIPERGQDGFILGVI